MATSASESSILQKTIPTYNQGNSIPLQMLILKESKESKDDEGTTSTDPPEITEVDNSEVSVEWRIEALQYLC